MSGLEVKPGQVWEAHETVWSWKRNVRVAVIKTRTLHVLELVGRNHYGGTEPSARCHVVETGRKVVVALRRMLKPGKARGYRLVSEAPPASTPT